MKGCVGEIRKREREKERERERERNKQYKTKMLMPFGINLIRHIMYVYMYGALITGQVIPT